jgi:hypothetical protein
MTAEVRLSRVEAEFNDHSFLIARDALAESCADTTVFADGDT